MKAFMLSNMESTYWLVRQAILIVTFFGGLCLQEYHQQDTAFLVPVQGGLAARLDDYMAKINTGLNKFTGLV